METIITIEEAKTLGRPIGKVANEKIQSFIFEVENTIIRKSLGDELYMLILDHKAGRVYDPSYTAEFGDKIDMLLSGGIYTTTCGSRKYFVGIKTAIAYYVYAQNVRAGDFESTRYGMVIKEDSYSQGISSKERDQVANSATEVADCYLKECLEYCRNKGIKVSGINKSERITSGCVIRKIG